MHDQHRPLPRRRQTAREVSRASCRPACGSPAHQDGQGSADRRGLLRHLWSRRCWHRDAGCSLCMGNQARVAEGASVVSTSTRNFPNRLGKGANVYLASAELAAVAALIGKLPTPEEYQTYVAQVDKTAVDTYRYLNFNQLSQYTEKADGVIFQTAV
ncbi:aconitase family protein [Escherichia coli]